LNAFLSPAHANIARFIIFWGKTAGKRGILNEWVVKNGPTGKPFK